MSAATAKWSTAFARFGLGARGDRAPAQGEPREAIEAELSAPGAGRLEDPALPASAQALAKLYEYVARDSDVRARAEALRAANVAMPTPEAAALMIPLAGAAPEKPANPVSEIFNLEAAARLRAALAAPVGFVERLVAFWSNHFCISGAKGQNVRILAGAFERETIRPFVTGKFADMLAAAERHPAMLHYLDNAQSVGPESPVGRNAKRGLNENLAREILELHTLGVDGGYGQGDVTEFARVLTGWTVVGREAKAGTPGAFTFNVNAHEAGERALLGRRYDDNGLAQGEAVLADLARAPATARHIAHKFARAFVADAPPAPLVARLAHVFLATDGDLGELARALVADEAAWTAPATKLRDPWEMLVASLRALQIEPRPLQGYLDFLNLLGAPLWTPGGPNGFPDVAAAWISPEGMKARLEVAAVLGKLAKDAPAPRDLLERVLPAASPATVEAVLHAESRPQAYALTIMAPEFQRR